MQMNPAVFFPLVVNLSFIKSFLHGQIHARNVSATFSFFFFFLLNSFMLNTIGRRKSIFLLKILMITKKNGKVNWSVNFSVLQFYSLSCMDKCENFVPT